ncbi:hypothetical protein PIB30_003162 [Stylosanthes scabra]|uniref:F-box/kelch-repeat protein n=1 Tax=Stylosanthes scabra TaxID=79078 RepID=A0ABU6Z411_9FABA|nr:hypothetical protein [Stylosanthes scabra]
MSIIPVSLSSLASDMSVPALLSSVTAATATATALFLICKSRLMLLRPHEKNLVTLHPEQPKSDARGKMIFFSQIGTSKALAKRLCDNLESNLVILEPVDARNYEARSPTEGEPRRPRCFNFGSLEPTFHTRSILPGQHTFRSKGICGRHRVTENGKNLMAKVANLIRDLGQIAELNSDFDSWWGSVVAVLQSAVLGVAASLELEPEPEPEDVALSDPKHLNILVENVNFVRVNTDSLVGVSRTVKHRMFTIIDEDNGTLKKRGHVPAQWPLREDLLLSNTPLPPFQGFCYLGSCLFLAGGMEIGASTDLIEDFDDTTKLWRLKYDDSTFTWAWSICGDLFCRRISPLVVPWDGKLYIFGGENVGTHWVDIYTIGSGLWEKREVPENLGFVDPRSYFLWEDSNKHHKIVLYFCYDDHQWLMSYDVNTNSWEKVSCNFPQAPEYYSRKIIRLGCNLLIVDSHASVWYIYDLVEKEHIAIVSVDGFDDNMIMSDIFCCHHTNEESLIYVFMEPNEMDIKLEESFQPQRVSYARVKLELQTFSAKIEYQGHLKVGPYFKHYIFAVRNEGNQEKNLV